MTVKLDKAIFELTYDGKNITVSETYTRQYDINDIVIKNTEEYKILDWRFVPIQGGSVWQFEYQCKQIAGIREHDENDWITL